MNKKSSSKCSFYMSLYFEVRFLWIRPAVCQRPLGPNKCAPKMFGLVLIEPCFIVFRAPCAHIRAEPNNTTKPSASEHHGRGNGLEILKCIDCPRNNSALVDPKPSNARFPLKSSPSPPPLAFEEGPSMLCNTIFGRMRNTGIPASAERMVCVALTLYHLHCCECAL